MADYTPTTANVRDCYIYADERYDGEIATPPGTAGAQFDRWLASRDRVVAANAWDEGVWLAANSDAAALEFQKINPYRITEENN